MGYPEQRLAAFGERSGIPVLALDKVMKPGMYLRSGHWTREAHRTAAESVAQRLCRATARPG
jgi:hypothetical protein